MQVKEHTVIKTRTAGWNQILNGKCDADLTITDKIQSFFPSLEEDLNCDERDGEAVLNKSQRFWVSMQQAAEDESAIDIPLVSDVGNLLGSVGIMEFAELGLLTDDVRAGDGAGGDKGVSDVLVSAKSTYARGALGALGNQEIVENYSLHGGSYWHSPDFEDTHGYDARLKSEIEDPFGKLEDLFPNLFPKE